MQMYVSSAAGNRQAAGEGMGREVKKVIVMVIVVALFVIAVSYSQQKKLTTPDPNQLPTSGSIVPLLGATALAASERPISETAVREVAPYPNAPLCPDSGEAHDNSLFHTLWDSRRGCHYDHEHGQNPFTREVAKSFPRFDLRKLLGGVGVGHTNPSSPMENTHKHGGFKWDVTLSHSAGCEGTPTGVDALVVQYHAFGDYEVEFETAVHSAVGLLRQCRPGNPQDYGYVFVNQHQNYGQRVTPYQGTAIRYPDTPVPGYAPGIAPYFTVDCVAVGVTQCRPSRQFVLDRNSNASSTWTSRPQAAPLGSTLFSILFRVRDNYQLFDWNDQQHPFTFVWLCSADGGLSYSAESPVGCRYNNTTTRIHEVHGTIPVSWDNLAGFDTDQRPGRVTAEGFVTRYGDLNPACTTAGPDCHPIKLVSAFTGPYSSAFGLEGGKGSFSVADLPERDIYFCAGVPCNEGDPGAIASGWLGPSN